MTTESSIPAPVPVPVFMQRLSGLPGVDATLQKVSAAYSYGRNSNAYVKSALETLEGKVEDLVKTAANTPAVKKVDSMACAGLDKVENTTTTIRTSIHATTKAASDYTTNVLKAIENTVCAASNMVIGRVDAVVDTTLPAAKEENGSSGTHATTDTTPVEVDAAAVAMPSAPPTTTPPPLGDETRRVVQNARKLTAKVQARAYYHAMSKLQGVKVRSEAAVENLKPYTLDLLVYAREHLDKLADMEDEDDQENGHDESKKQSDQAAFGNGTSSTTTTTTTVAGSTTAGALVSLAQRTGRKLVSRSARQVRSWVDTGVFVIHWAVSSAKQTPQLITNVGVLVQMEATNAANIIHQQAHAATYNGRVLVTTVQHYANEAQDRTIAWKNGIQHGTYDFYEQHMYPFYEKDIIPFYQQYVHPTEAYVMDSVRFGLKVGSDVVVLTPQAVTIVIQIVLGYAVATVNVIENSSVVQQMRVKLNEVWKLPTVTMIRHFVDNAYQRIVQVVVVPPVTARRS